MQSIPIYYFSFVKCPKSVVRRIEKLQKDFLWNDHVDKRKYHLVRWDLICKPTEQVGLGIRSIEKVNKALLGKWLWRIGESYQGLWRQILISKYKLDDDGWCVPGQMFKATGFWKSILSGKDDFFPWIRFRVRDGRQVRFWHDEWWCGQSTFLTLFPNLYLLDRRWQAIAADNFLITSGEVVWDFNFHGTMALLDNVYVHGGGCDVRVWKPAAKGNFSVKLFYNPLLDSSNPIQVGKRFWDSTIPHQVLGGKVS